MSDSESPELIPPVPEAKPEGIVVPSDSDTLPVVVVDETPPPPYGRTWAFDVERNEFVRVGSHSPRAIYGVLSLVGWIDKCLQTERGALPIHPPGYGMQDPFAVFGRPIRELSVQELQRQINDALTFHPRIAEVVGLELREIDDQAFAVFKVQPDPPLDEAELLSIQLNLGPL